MAIEINANSSESIGGYPNGTSTLTSEQLHQRNEDIVAFAAQHPELKNATNWIEIRAQPRNNPPNSREGGTKSALQKKRIEEKARLSGFMP
jgi:hypothetical protein